MANLQQSVEELLEEAERNQQQQTIKTEPKEPKIKLENNDDDTDFKQQGDFVPLGDDSKNDRRTNGRARDGRRGGKNNRYSDDGEDRKSRALSDDEGHKSDQGSANGSVRSRRRSRSPRGGRNNRDDRRYRSRSRDRGGRGGPRDDDDGDRYYRPGPRDRIDRRDPRHDDSRNGDRRDRRDDRRDGGRRERRRTPPEPTDDERDRRTVFVQQLAARLRTKELMTFFEQVGPVKEAQIVKDRVSGRSKG